MKAGIPNF